MAVHRHGTTAVATYTPRVRKRLPIAAPVTWKQIKQGIHRTLSRWRTHSQHTGKPCSNVPLSKPRRQYVKKSGPEVKIADLPEMDDEGSRFIRFGAVRTVFVGKKYVFKLPGKWQPTLWRWWWRDLLHGLLSNMQERIFSKETDWPGLCPVSFSLPGGFLVVMPTARPLTDTEWRGLDYPQFVSRGDPALENYESHAGDWKQGDLD